MSYYSEYDDGKKEKEKTATMHQDAGTRATAEGSVMMNAAAFQAFLTGSHGGMSEAWTVSRLAGIQGAKHADELLLVSHSCNIVGIEMDYETEDASQKVTIRCDVKIRERIGAETAALVGCGMALMVLVDALRAIDRGMKIENLHIVRE